MFPYKFPFQAKLVVEPQSLYAKEHMTVGKVYTVHGWAGSCWRVDTDVDGDKTLISPDWFEIVKSS